MSHTDDFPPALTSDVSTWLPAPAQSLSGSPENDDDDHSPTTRSAKRKFERKSAASNPLPSKRARASDGRWLLPTCRGGSTRRRRVVLDSDDEDDDDDESSKSAPEKGPATPTKEPAAKSDEKNDEGESTSSSQKPINDTDGSGSKDADNSSEPTSNSRKTDDTSSEDADNIFGDFRTDLNQVNKQKGLL
jgi:hypothetical protein